MSCSSILRCKDSNPQPLKHESSPINSQSANGHFLIMKIVGPDEFYQIFIIVSLINFIIITIYLNSSKYFSLNSLFKTLELITSKYFPFLYISDLDIPSFLKPNAKLNFVKKRFK